MEMFRKTTEKVAAIKYRITGSEFGYMYGTTTLSGTESSNVINISVIPLDTSAKVTRCIDMLKTSDNNYFLKIHFLDDGNKKHPGIITERIQNTCQSFFEKKFAKWQRQKRVKSLPWFEFIESDFKAIFRDVFKGLVCLYNRQCHHGNISKGVFVSHEGRGKLFNMTNQKESYILGMQSDFDDIREVIAGIFRLEQGLEKSFEDLVLPPDLRIFLSRRTPSSVSGFKTLEWFFEDCAFWSPVERFKFMDTIYYYMYKDSVVPPPCVSSAIKASRVSLGIRDHQPWWEKVPRDDTDRFRQILEDHDRVAKLKKEAERYIPNKEDGENQEAEKKRSAFDEEAVKREIVKKYKFDSEIVRFFRNVHVHYNDPLREELRVNRVKLDIMLHKMFPQTCNIIRHAVELCINCNNLRNGGIRQKQLITELLRISTHEKTVFETTLGP